MSSSLGDWLPISPGYRPSSMLYCYYYYYMLHLGLTVKVTWKLLYSCLACSILLTKQVWLMKPHHISASLFELASIYLYSFQWARSQAVSSNLFPHDLIRVNCPKYGEKLSPGIDINFIYSSSYFLLQPTDIPWILSGLRLISLALIHFCFMRMRYSFHCTSYF